MPTAEETRYFGSTICMGSLNHATCSTARGHYRRSTPSHCAFCCRSIQSPARARHCKVFPQKQRERCTVIACLIWLPLPLSLETSADLVFIGDITSAQAQEGAATDGPRHPDLALPDAALSGAAAAAALQQIAAPTQNGDARVCVSCLLGCVVLITDLRAGTEDVAHVIVDLPPGFIASQDTQLVIEVCSCCASSPCCNEPAHHSQHVIKT